MFGQEKKKKTAAEMAGEGAANLNKFGTATKKSGDIVKNVQDYAKAENERKAKEAEAKKKAPVKTAPEDGFLTKMYKKYVSGGK